jgi:hypothetical protein
VMAPMIYRCWISRIKSLFMQTNRKEKAESSISSLGLDGVLYLLGYRHRHWYDGVGVKYDKVKNKAVQKMIFCSLFFSNGKYFFRF